MTLPRLFRKEQPLPGMRSRRLDVYGVLVFLAEGSAQISFSNFVSRSMHPELTYSSFINDG